MKIIGVWHIAKLGSWEKIYLAQYQKLTDSGLLDKTEKIYISLVGTKNKDDLKLLTKNSKIEFYIGKNNPKIAYLNCLNKNLYLFKATPNHWK